MLGKFQAAKSPSKKGNRRKWQQALQSCARAFARQAGTLAML